MFNEELGTAISIGVGSRNGELEAWSVGTDGMLYRYNQYTLSPNPWVAMDAEDASGGMLTPLDSVSISSDGDLWILTAAGKAYRYNWPSQNPHFEAVPLGEGNENVRLDALSVGNADAIWAVDTNKNIYQYNKGMGWNLITPSTAVDVAVSADGTVMALNKVGEVYTYRGSNKWKQMSGVQLDSIAIESMNRAWGTHQGALWQYTGGVWQEVKDASGKTVSGVQDVAANVSGKVFLIDRNHGIWYKGDARVGANKAAHTKKSATRSKMAQEGKLKIADAKKSAKKAVLKKSAVADKAGAFDDKKVVPQAQRRNHASKQAIQKKLADQYADKSLGFKFAKPAETKVSNLRAVNQYVEVRNPSKVKTYPVEKNAAKN